jgi:hypothetical protein
MERTTRFAVDRSGSGKLQQVVTGGGERERKREKRIRMAPVFARRLLSLYRRKRRGMRLGR